MVRDYGVEGREIAGKPCKYCEFATLGCLRIMPQNHVRSDVETGQRDMILVHIMGRFLTSLE